MNPQTLSEMQWQIFKSLYGESASLSKIYHCKDGRKRVEVITPGRSKTLQLARLLLEIKLERLLMEGETVDHINGDPTDDSLNNLALETLSSNAKLSVKRVKEQNFKCPYCNNQFTLSGKRISDSIANRNKGKAGPFCSKSCVGKYGANLQNGYINKIEILNVQEREYYTLKDK